jgi:beta-N-acetylhexosaminidase
MTKLKTALLYLIILALFLTGCTKNTSSVISETEYVNSFVTKPVQKTEEEIRIEKVNEQINNLSLEQKVGQLFIISPEALCSKGGTVTEFSEEILDNLNKYTPGGVIFFGGNIVDPVQLTAFTNCFKNSDGIPMFISVDEEGGSVARIGNSKNFDVQTFTSMKSVGNSGDTSKAFEVGSVIGEYLNDYSFNLNFAPVADINTNPQNKVIGSRAFGSNPETVSEMVSYCIDGFHSKNIMTCIKHFPGHGDTKGDTHTGYVSITKSWEELKECELIPFIKNLDKTDMIMVSHITAENVTSDLFPASLSYEMLTNKLRNELGFNGVIITDSLQMGAIKKNYTSAEASLKAFKAGADILLMPENFKESYNEVLNAVKSGEISEQRLNESVQRILMLKDKYLKQ